MRLLHTTTLCVVDAFTTYTDTMESNEMMVF